MAISVVGIDFKTASVEVREQLALSRGEVARVLQAVAGERIFPEAAVLSTCNRVEFYFASDEEKPGDLEHLLEHVAEAKGDGPPAQKSIFFRHDGDEAVRHLFRVASSLESLIVGEREIQGQVKEAYRLACEARTAKFLIHKLMHWAFRAAKRVMTETALGTGTASISQAAVDLSRQVFASLADKTVLLVGAGQMAELACQSLVRAGASRLIVANRTLANARELVDRFAAWQEQEARRRSSGAGDEDEAPVRCPALAKILAECPLRPQAGEGSSPSLRTSAIALEEIPAALPGVDLLLCSSGAAEPVLRPEDLRKVPGGIRHSLLMIDISVPRNIDPAVEKESNVFLYNIDALEALVAANVARRRQEIPRAEAIIGDEAERFSQWASALGVVPTIKLLARHFAELQQAEIERYQKKFPASERGQLQEFARVLCAKILHDPIAFLRSLDGKTARHQDLSAVNTLREIFHLDPEDSAEEEK
jgi:glutamyl-tRNA reductase